MPDEASAWPWGHLTPGGYGVILADPPWRFQARSAKGEGRSASRHYRTMTLPDIKALPVADLAAKDCVLFLWGLANMTDVAIDTMKGWGFAFKTTAVWVKTTKSGNPAFGTGYIMRNAQEPIIVGTRGAPKRMSRSERDVIEARRREHSRKPEEIYRKARALYPGPYAELFARTRRPGWDVWGDQVDTFDISVPLLEPRPQQPDLLAAE